MVLDAVVFFFFFRMIWASPPRNKIDAIYIYINQNNCQKVVLVKGQILFEVFAGSAKTSRFLDLKRPECVTWMGKKRVEVPKTTVHTQYYHYLCISKCCCGIVLNISSALCKHDLTHTYIKNLMFSKKTSTLPFWQ